MNAGYHAWGHSMVIDPMGCVLAEAGEDEEIVYAVVEPDVLRSTRAGIPVTVQRRFDVYSELRELPN
jgi:omega-amidase